MQFKRTAPKKQSTICEHNCTNCALLKVSFFAFFIFVFGTSPFGELLFDRHKNKMIEIHRKPKQEGTRKQTKTRRNQKTRCKEWTSSLVLRIVRNRNSTHTQTTWEHLETWSKQQNKGKKQEPKTEFKTNIEPTFTNTRVARKQCFQNQQNETKTNRKQKNKKQTKRQQK